MTKHKQMLQHLVTSKDAVIHGLLYDHGLRFFSKNGCVFCQRLEDLVAALDIPCNKYVVDPSLVDPSEYTQMISFLKEHTNMSTFPMIYLGQTKIGGFTEFQHLVMTHQLDALLEKNDISTSALF